VLWYPRDMVRRMESQRAVRRSWCCATSTRPTWTALAGFSSASRWRTPPVQVHAQVVSFLTQLAKSEWADAQHEWGAGFAAPARRDERSLGRRSARRRI